MTSRLVPIGDTRLFIDERGRGYPVLVLHGGPGLDHHMYADYLDPLQDRLRLILVDQRAQGQSDPAPADTWSLAQMAADVGALAEALELERFAVLGHSYGALVALQHAVDFPGEAAQSIISSGFPSAKYLAHVDANLAAFEPESLRAQVADSWEREKSVRTREDVHRLLHDQMPFHFAHPLDPRIADFERRTADQITSPDVLRTFANREYGGIEVEERLGRVTQPVLVLVGAHDRVSSLAACRSIAEGVEQGEMVVFDNSGHMTFVEENPRYLEVVADFLRRHAQL
ncbi:MAG TPA: alpha/beta fold hydrolase [Anaerolineales bacterium]|nr:alpha/beta fold hydrolase [Anaerolineales bacterium]